MIALEMGKPVREAKGEVKLSSAIYRYYADNGPPALLEAERLDVPGADESVVYRRPIGALVGVMPWNYPYYQVARFARRTSCSATPCCSSTPRTVRSRHC